MQRRRKRQVDPEVLVEIEELHSLGFGAADAHRRIEEQFGPVVSYKTVYRIMTEDLPERDPSGSWSLIAEDTPERAGHVLDVLAAVVALSEGNITDFTVHEAGVVARLRLARPDIPAWDAWKLAGWYIQQGARARSTRDLDAYVAFAPWKGDAQLRAYYRATGRNELGWNTDEQSPLKLVWLAKVGWGSETGKERVDND